MSIEHINQDNKQIILVGTAHVSRSSVEEVRQAIEDTNPEIVAVELCQNRYDVLKNPKTWQETDIIKIIKEKKAAFLFANLVLASFQKRIGEKLGIRPGQEMKEAIDIAEGAGLPVALIDRSVQITLQRAWRKLTVKERFKLMGTSLAAIFTTDDLEEDEIERFKEKDVLTAAIDELAKQAPTIKQVLLDERDAYMAKKILEQDTDKILAVVGAGHVNGLIKQLQNPLDDISPLEEVPAKKPGLFKWLLPCAIFILVIAGFFYGGSDQGFEMVKWWLASNAFFAALGATIALSHPVTIMVAAVASPITSLNPTLAAGWFAGLSEAFFRKPKVSDFELIQEDLGSLKGFWKNSITRILMVVILANIGSSLGAYLAMPILTKIILAG